ncbi:putative membrane protein [Paenibacillus favisporus]|uniref:Membrane protein n=1 Tax=Paenibacillus favisporus TaxID=221028 RepID=A0ABV2EZZ0_9BACL
MGIKVSNFYYLIAGIFALLFAATHAWNGQSAVLPELQIGAITMGTRTVFMCVWHIITAENLVFGVMFIWMSFQSDRSKVRFVAWMIVSLLIVRLMVILGVTAFQDASSLTDTLIDSIAIVIYVAFIILGIRMKPKKAGGSEASF